MPNTSFRRLSAIRRHTGYPGLGVLVLLAAAYTPTQAGNLDSQSIAAGKYHFCAIVGGGAQCWGDNFDGQLGDGSFHDSTTPVAVQGLQSGVTALVPGGYHTCAIVNGGVKCWGNNSDGQLGDGTLNDSSTPVAVQGLSSGVVALAGGDYHTCAVVNGGTVRCWGWNGEGQLGNNTTTATKTNPPVTVIGIASGATALAAGNAHTCAIVSGGVRCWGNNAWGELDDGTLTTRYTAVTALGLSGVAAISAGFNHTCAILGDGSVRCWGRNNNGQLGNDSVVPSGTNPPVQPSGIASGATSIAAGSFFTCATVSGAAKCWGSNFDGELGDGTLNERHVPAGVNNLGAGVAAIAAGDTSACAQLPGSQQVRCWGNNIDGEIGLGTADSTVRTVPVPVTSLSSGVTALGRGSLGEHTCAIVGGAARCWGNNGLGEIGDGTLLRRSTPVAVSGLASGVASIAVGNEHTCAIAGGAVKCWGNNDHGQLGVGSSGGYSSVPATAVAAGASAVAAGVWHTCAIVGTGVQCWGYNNDGQLGNGSTTQGNSPVSVAGLAGTPVALAAGAWHTCAVLSNGTVQCWGYNSNGQLGNNSTTATKTSPPVTVSNIASGATAITAGGYHTCAIVGGGVRCWGFGQDGELGNAAFADSHVPVATSGLSSGVSAIAAGWWHVCAIAGGALSCWGFNNSGPLGNGSRDDRATPTPVSGFAANVSAVGGGHTHACAVVNGAMKCWGGDYWGQLGDGRITFFTNAQTVVASTSPAAAASCGATPVSVNPVPTTQAESQPVLFNLSVGNVDGPGGTVAVYSDGAAICTAPKSSEPFASCWGYMSLGTHAVVAVYSGIGVYPSGCSSSVPVTILPNTGLSGTLLTLSTSANLQQGASLDLNAQPNKKPQPPSPASAGVPSAAAADTFSGYVTFYDGTNEIGSAPVINNMATFTNTFVSGTHQFSASYSGDAAFTTSVGIDAVQITKPADDIFYAGFELPPD